MIDNRLDGNRCEELCNCLHIKDLEKQLKEKTEEVERVKNEKDLLNREIGSLRGQIFSKKRKKENKEAKVLKKRGAPVGHAGWYRDVPKAADETVDIYPEKCPICGGANLSDCEKVDEHMQEDIVFPKVKATLYKHHYKYCSDCKKVVGSGVGKDELINSYIGPNAKAMSVFFKYDVKMSDRDLQRALKLFGLTVVPSSIPGFRNQLRRNGLEAYTYLIGQIRQSSYVNADETGWKVDGKNHWLWNFSNDKISVNHIDKSRGRKVALNILGEDYDGVVISDFLSAYDKFKNNQRCLVHLFRDIKKIMELHSDNEPTQVYCKRLKDIFYQAEDLKIEYTQENKYSQEEYLKKCKAVEDSLDDLQFPDPQKGMLLRISKRLKKYKEELFTFLYHKNVPSHNNHAEQQIRPNVLLRKITFGNRSQAGILNHNVLMSLIQTGKLNNRNIFDLLKTTFTAKNKNEVINYIFSP